jgi:ABC-type multidrug transport system fused ATPase/permease subunit
LHLKLFKTIQTILANLTFEEQRNGIWIMTLMILNAALDFFSVAAFIPLLASIIDPNFITENSAINNLYGLLGFTSRISFIITITIGVFIFILLKNLISVLIAKLKARYAFNIRSELSARAFIHYMQSSFLEFTRADFTRVLNTITNYPLAFANNLVLPITTILSEALVAIFVLTCVVLYDYKVLLLLVFILLPVAVIVNIWKKNYRNISHELKTAYPEFLKYANQAVEGFVEISTYQKTPYFYQRFQKVSKRLTETLIENQTLQAGTLRLTEIIVAIVMCSLIIYAVVTQLPYQQTLVLMGLYAGASFRIVPSVNRILSAFQQIRTNEYLLDEFKIPVTKTTALTEVLTPDFVFADSIVLKNISFDYADGPNALRGVSLTIRKGEKVAITGASGEGKTTFLLVLLGLLQQTEGQILVDGNAIQDKNAWKKIIGYVAQNPYILDGSIVENIAFGIPPENIDSARVLQLIHNLGLSALVSNLPDGMDSRIGERGAKLSGGQRQRLAIARALYADAEIFLLDEITNQLDAKTQTGIMNIIHSGALKHKTIIIISHHVEETNLFDSVYELRAGSFVPISKKLNEKV